MVTLASNKGIELYLPRYSYNNDLQRCDESACENAEGEGKGEVGDNRATVYIYK